MGSVHLAVRDDDHYRKEVAIKLLKRGMDTDFMLNRFRQERQILANLEHPFIRRRYLVPRYLPGRAEARKHRKSRRRIWNRLDLACGWPTAWPDCSARNRLSNGSGLVCRRQTGRIQHVPARRDTERYLARRACSRGQATTVDQFARCGYKAGDFSGWAVDRLSVRRLRTSGSLPGEFS